MKNGVTIDRNRLGKFRGAGLGGTQSQPAKQHEDADSLRSTQYATVVDLLSEGPIGWLCDANWNPLRGGQNAAVAVWFNQSPLANDPNSGAMNFNGVSINGTPGWATQGVLPGFRSEEDTINVGVTLLHGVGFIFSIDDPNTTACSVGIRVPQLMYQDSKGNIYAYHVTFELELNLNGAGFYSLGTFQISGKCTSDYVREYAIQLPHSAYPDNDYWQVRVTRYDSDDADSKHLSLIILDYYTRHIDLPMMYPYSAVIGVQIDASQLSDIPTRAYRLKGLLVQVPSNYFPLTRSYTRNQYTGVDTRVYQPWNGTFYYAWSSNPAWVFYDMATNDRYGAGEFLGNGIDKWSLYNIAMYCDQGVPDGVGGWEPRFTCNTYIQAQEQAWKVLSDLASVFRGMLYWGQGMVVPVQDAPKSIMHSFTNANVVDGRFTYSDAELKNRNSDAEVTYNDPQDFFSTKTQSVFDTDMRQRYGYRDTKFTSFGCTSRGQAHRHGTYVLVTNRYETETVVFQTGLEAMYLRPGDVIGIVDNYRIGLRQGGRVKGINGHNVTLDSYIAPFPDAQEIFFYIAYDTPAIGDYFPNSNQAATARGPMTWQGYIYGMKGAANNTIYVQDGHGNPPPVWAMPYAAVYVIGANYNTPNIVPQAQFRILTIAEREKNVFEITAQNYEPDKYNLIDYGIQLTPPLYTRIPPMTYVLPPNHLSAQLQVINNNNVLTVNILVTWQQPPEANIRSYILWVKPPHGGWSYVGETTSTEYIVPSALPGLYYFNVRSVNVASIQSVPVQTTITVPDTSLIVPHRLSGLELQGQGNNFTYYAASPTLAWRLNTNAHSYPINSEAPYGVGVGNYDPYFVNFHINVFDANTGTLGWRDQTTALQYTIDHAKNANAWGDGKARHWLKVTVQDTDAFGVEYSPSHITIDNPPPPPPTNLSAVVAAGTAGTARVVGLLWTDPRSIVATAPQAIDVVSVNIYRGTVNDVTQATVFATTHANSNDWNGVCAGGTWWFFVTLVDSFGSESTATPGVSVTV